MESGPLRNPYRHSPTIELINVVSARRGGIYAMVSLVLIQVSCTVQFDDATPLDSPTAEDTETTPVDDTADTDEPTPDPPTDTLADAMDLDRLMGHLAALQAIADEHLDTRVVGSSGFNQSADYVASQLEAAGFEVTWQEFAHSVWQVLADPILESDDGSSWESDDDYVVMSYSPGGAVTGPLAVIDVDIPPSGTENTSDSGCESSDFDGMTAGSIALIQRGSCTFLAKAQNAESAGAAGVIIFNEGQSGRQDVVQGTLGEAPDLSIPVLGANYQVGLELAEAAEDGTVTIRLEAEVLSQNLPTYGTCWRIWRATLINSWWSVPTWTALPQGLASMTMVRARPWFWKWRYKLPRWTELGTIHSALHGGVLRSRD